jgi:hypothetical protein
MKTTDTEKGTNMNPHQTHLKRTQVALARLAALAVVALFAVPGISAGTGVGRDDRPVFRNVRAQTEQFIDYYSAIRLTPTQERIKAEALDSIPAPCCKNYSMKTCCCPCNLAKSAWGLSNYLIAKKGYGAPEVKSAVVGWLAFINPNGFTGNACFTGGCKRPFAQNGCAGMDAAHVILGDDVQ